MAPPTADPRGLGGRGEDRAADYLVNRGYVVLERGFRMLRGEIDIIARQGPTIVFVEVKTRTARDFGLPCQAVTPLKQNRLRRIALGYLMKKGLPEERTACRFDVVSVTHLGGERFEIVHIEDAF